MSKKKKKKTNLLAIIGGAVVVALVVILLCLFLVAPNPEKLGEKFESKGYLALVVKEGDSSLGDATLALIGATATVGSLDNENGVYVVYFKDMDDAKEIMEDYKEDAEKDDDVVCIRRGKAVFIGTKEAGKIFRTQLG